MGGNEDGKWEGTNGMCENEDGKCEETSRMGENTDGKCEETNGICGRIIKKVEKNP